jgi:hypothetical protein
MKTSQQTITDKGNQRIFEFCRLDIYPYWYGRFSTYRLMNPKNLFPNFKEEINVAK